MEHDMCAPLRPDGRLQAQHAEADSSYRSDVLLSSPKIMQVSVVIL
jgi:hypothetical protein